MGGKKDIYVFVYYHINACEDSSWHPGTNSSCPDAGTNPPCFLLSKASPLVNFESLLQAKVTAQRCGSSEHHGASQPVSGTMQLVTELLSPNTCLMVVSTLVVRRPQPRAPPWLPMIRSKFFPGLR